MVGMSDPAASVPEPKADPSVESKLERRRVELREQERREPASAGGGAVVGNLGIAPTAGQLQVLMHATQESATGPLPPPAMLAEYEKLIPGFGMRMLAQADAEAAHRHQLENREMVLAESTVSARIKLSTWGFFAATAVGVGTLGVAVYALSLGHSLAAGSIVGGLALAGGSVHYAGRKYGRPPVQAPGEPT